MRSTVAIDSTIAAAATNFSLLFGMEDRQQGYKRCLENSEVM
jgi:hypothetical protein